MNNELIVIETINAVEVFSDRRNLEPFLKDIEQVVMAHVPDLSTAQGRSDIASLSYKVAQTKVRLDSLGKKLVEDWKASAKRVDESRKLARDFLDDLKIKARQPLTDWEDAETVRIKAEKLKLEIEQAHGEALAENSLFDRQKEIERKEAEFARIDAERRAKEDAERKVKEQTERDERIRVEAAEKAKNAAEEANAKAKAEAEKKIAEAKVNEERAKREKIEAIEKAQRDQEAAVKEAERKAKVEAERKERDRLETEAREKAAVEKKAANAKHRAKINNEAVAGMVSLGVSSTLANALVAAIAAGNIAHVKILY